MNLVKYNAAGQILQDEARFAPQGVVCSAYVSATIAAATGVRKVAFNALRFDPFAFFDLTNNRFTPKQPGYYRLSALVDIAGNPAGAAFLQWWRNGAFYSYAGFLNPAPTGEAMLADSVLMYFNGSTDFAEVYVNTAGSCPIGGGANPTTRFDADLVAASVGVAPEPWHIIGAAGEPAFQNSWSNFDSQRVARFYKEPNGTVRLGGLIKAASSGNLGQAAFTLPAGYRIAVGGGGNVYVTVPSNAAFGYVGIYENGNVTPQAGSITWFDLAGISFRAEQ